MHDVLKGDRFFARAPFLPPSCPWRKQYESTVIPKAQYEFLMQRVLTLKTAHNKILLSYLLWGGERFHSESLLLPCHLIANFFGHSESSNTNTGMLLQDFQHAVLGQIPGVVLEVQEHDWVEHKCRRVEAFHLGVFQAEFDALGRKNGRFVRVNDMPPGSMVHLHDGSTLTSSLSDFLRNERGGIGVNWVWPLGSSVLTTILRC